MKIEFETKTFSVSDYRDNPYPHNRGIDICAGHGDGLYGLGMEELKELREVVDKIISSLKEEEKKLFEKTS